MDCLHADCTFERIAFKLLSLYSIGLEMRSHQGWI